MACYTRRADANRQCANAARPAPELERSQALGPSSPHRHFVKDFLGRSCTKTCKNLLACGANQLLANGEIVPFLPPPELERSHRRLLIISAPAPPNKCKPPAVLRSLPPASLRGECMIPQAPAVLWARLQRPRTPAPFSCMPIDWHWRSPVGSTSMPPGWRAVVAAGQCQVVVGTRVLEVLALPHCSPGLFFLRLSGARPLGRGWVAPGGGFWLSAPRLSR
jgi:hypothetical protein